MLQWLGKREPTTTTLINREMQYFNERRLQGYLRKQELYLVNCKSQSGHGSGPFMVETRQTTKNKIYVTFLHLEINHNVSIIIH